MSMVECSQHGSMRPAFVCIHIVKSLSDNKPVGFVWVRDEESQINAYCDLCETELNKSGGEWNDQNEKFADVRLLCEYCALYAAQVNGVEIDR